MTRVIEPNSLSREHNIRVDRITEQEPNVVLKAPVEVAESEAVLSVPTVDLRPSPNKVVRLSLDNVADLSEIVEEELDRKIVLSEPEISSIFEEIPTEDLIAKTFESSLETDSMNLKNTDDDLGIREEVVIEGPETSQSIKGLETNSTESHDLRVTILRELIENEFNIFLQGLEPIKANEVVELMNNLLELINTVVHISGDTPESLPHDSIHKICQELFETLGIVYDGESLEAFIQLLVEQYIETGILVLADNIEYLNRMGTREYKPSDSNTDATGLINQIRGLPLHLGRICLSQIVA